MSEAPFSCIRCHASYSITAALDACSVCWPRQGWLAFTCPACKHEAKIEVRGKTLTLGDIDGAPGPCFFPDSPTVEVPGLKAKKEYGGMQLALDERKWNFRMKRGPKQAK